MAAAERVGDLNTRQTLERQQQVLQTQEDLQAHLSRIAAFALLLGCAVAAFSIIRTRSLEAAAAIHLAEIEQRATEMRGLSQMLAKAQEDERRSLSRELHDQVGQMMTALSMELGHLEELREVPRDFERHLAEAKKLNQETMRTVRNISSGLRPSMLDELGLAPALQWQAREFTKRSGVSVDLQLEGGFTNLPDEHRTCIYRVVQEALTNAARHARAKSIRVSLVGEGDSLRLIVEDDGSGIDVQEARGRGLGLVNIEERVRELGGRVQFLRAEPRGTRVHCEMPIPREVPT
jgi:signal transduction histidine kinase